MTHCLYVQCMYVHIYVRMYSTVLGLTICTCIRTEVTYVTSTFIVHHLRHKKENQIEEAKK